MRLKLGIITLLSALHDATMVENSHYDFISGLRRNFDIAFIDPEDAGSVDLPIVFIGSGGTENYFRSVYSLLPKPVIILADSMHNSLAASMEISAWIRELGDESTILYGNLEETVAQIKYSYILRTAKKRLSEMSIGVVGFPSDWLIASDVSYTEVQKKWGVVYRNIEIRELGRYIAEASADKAMKIAAEFGSRAASVKEPNEKDVVEAAKIYLALKALGEEHEVNAMTLRCFELLSEYRTTGCLALSLLNDENIVVGCEGDLQSVFSMLLLNVLTDAKAFTSNPSSIDTGKNEIILAHCTIPTSMTSKYIVRSHFESHIGVGIQGTVEEGDVTVFKCGGSRLDKYFVSSGRLVENLDYDNMCRTQLKIRLDSDVSYFVRNPLANHHIVIKGDHAKLIDRFMQDIGCKRIV